jgi:hypothetical protein
VPEGLIKTNAHEPPPLARTAFKLEREIQRLSAAVTGLAR